LLLSAQDKHVDPTADGNAPILIETKDTVLALAKSPSGRIQVSYYGTRGQLPRGKDLKPIDEAYPTAGYDFVNEPAIRAIHADGNMSTLLVFDKVSTASLDENRTKTTISLRDPYYPFFVDLQFVAYKQENLIAQSVQVWNEESAPVTLYNFASASIPFQGGNYWLTQFHGDWANEVNMVEEKLVPGIKLLDSKLGIRAHERRTPMFLLGLGAPAGEDAGSVIGCQLAWSGSFQFAFEVNERNILRANVGMNPFGAQFSLPAKTKWESPEALFVFSNNGTGKMSRDFQNWGRKYGVRDGYKPRSILLNNWEATGMKFTEEKLATLFKGAKEAGFELFLLDDGWFGNKHPRNNDRAGLGDWEVNHQKLPNGVPGLCKSAQEVGIPFGIWVEPEMVNPQSELYEKHPDWVLVAPNRPLHLRRSQLVLDLTNPEVKEFSFAVVDDLLKANPYISFVKWDANRFLTNGGSPYLKPSEQSEIIYRYHRALYDNMDRTAKAHPNVRMMLCSGGGGRVDYAALKYFHEFWPSDNTDPLKRVFIQWGYSYFYPSIATAAHVTSWGKRPIKFGFDVAMSGRLGMDMDLAHLKPEELVFTKQAIAEYKRLRDTIQLGTQYRLVSPYNSDHAALMYVNGKGTEAVAFVFQIKGAGENVEKQIKLKGLDTGAIYTVTEINLRADYNDGKTRGESRKMSGADLMNKGIPCSLEKQLTSAVYEITKN
jgi:alpha-galactosidase